MDVRLIGVVVGAWLLVGQIPPDSEWTRADAATVRLPPARIAGLPAAVRGDLERRGCTIPQPFTMKPNRPQNAISGHFTSGAATDWAVLCSRQRRSSILVFRTGGVTKIDQLEEEADAARLQVAGPGPGEIGYSRGIGVATPVDIRSHNQNADPPLPVLDHDGIHDAFIEKGSIILYWSGSRWLKLAGTNRPTLRSNLALEPTSGTNVFVRLRARHLLAGPLAAQRGLGVLK